MSSAELLVRFQQVGFHKWPGGPDYLANRHRHLFHIEVRLDSTVDNERVVEFHDLLIHAKTVLRDVSTRTKEYDYGDMSCESIADAMARRLCRVYKRTVGVTVLEDGECGATVYADFDLE